MRTSLNLEYIYYKVYSFFAGAYEFVVDKDSAFWDFLFWVKIVSFLASLLLLAGIIYSIVKSIKTNKKQIVDFVKTITEAPPEERRTKWDKIKKYLESSNSSDWRMAIMEADNLIDDIIKKIGYKGETFGERLSQIKSYQFKNINEIWEAHKVRNRIAHEGERFNITKREAERVIGLYEQVLEEFEYL